jgi:hypothetical protein
VHEAAVEPARCLLRPAQLEQHLSHRQLVAGQLEALVGVAGLFLVEREVESAGLLVQGKRGGEV